MIQDKLLKLIRCQSDLSGYHSNVYRLHRETEAYLGLNDRAAHGYGGKITPKVTSLYKRGGTIYACHAYAFTH